MPDGQSSLAGSRSDQRIPKLRTRGRANRQKLLAEAERLIGGRGGEPVKFSDVFEAANVSRGSAYRIYDGIEDLRQDLASLWISQFVEYVNNAAKIDQPESWVELSDHLVARAAAYWAETEEKLRVLPRARGNVPDTYRAAVRELTEAIAETFNCYFVMPEISAWMSVLSMYTSLGDTIFADAVRREGRISEQRLVEAQVICRTYLSFYLPAWLQTRDAKT